MSKIAAQPSVLPSRASVHVASADASPSTGATPSAATGAALAPSATAAASPVAAAATDGAPRRAEVARLLGGHEGPDVPAPKNDAPLPLRLQMLAAEKRAEARRTSHRADVEVFMGMPIVSILGPSGKPKRFDYATRRADELSTDGGKLTRKMERVATYDLTNVSAQGVEEFLEAAVKGTKLATVWGYARYAEVHLFEQQGSLFMTLDLVGSFGSKRSQTEELQQDLRKIAFRHPAARRASNEIMP